MARNSQGAGGALARCYWKLTLGEWISLAMAFVTIVVLFCLFFIRRQTVELNLEHTYTVRSPEFFSSALALANPVPIAGNKVELLQNGDAFFPAMLEAIRGATQTINFAPTSLSQTRRAVSSATRSRRRRAAVCKSACCSTGSAPAGRSITPTCG
jgi:cardiolipin synthase